MCHDEIVNDNGGSEQVRIKALVADGRARLEAAGIAGPDAELLLGATLREPMGRVRYLIALDDVVTDETAASFRAAIERRAKREPLQHIIGTAPFRHIELEVGLGALVPRPETETLVDLALERLPSSGRVLDAGTGTGAIALAIATERPDAEVSAVELSPAAFIWAKRNIERLAPRVRLVFGDFAQVLRPGLALDVLVSNPPYVPFASIPRDPEVFLHDPGIALYSGPDGLDAIRALSRHGIRAVKPGGSIVVEHESGQGQRIRDIFSQDGWQSVLTHDDLTGRERFTTAVKP